MNNHNSNSSDTLDLSDIMCKYYDNANNFSNDCNSIHVLILFVFIYLMHLYTRASLSHSKTAGNQNVSQSHDSRLTSNVIKDKHSTSHLLSMVNNEDQCAICTCKISSSQLVISCIQCSLLFHSTCVSINYENASFWCNLCLHKTCLTELPYCDEPFIDLKCTLGKGLKIAHLNIQSLRNKVDHLNILLHKSNIDCLCLTETWLTENDDDAVLKIDDYLFYRMDRKHKGHGGIACYIKETINFKENTDMYINDVEALWIEINLPYTKPIILGTVYRVPDANAEYFENVDLMFQNCASIYDEIIILGDFNLDISKSPLSRKISGLANRSQLTQLINDFTRITPYS
jgi:hypothetical protein